MADQNRIPNDPSHPDHAFYQRLLEGVEGLHHWQGDQNANVAAALYEQVKADPRFPEQISQVVLGDPLARVPSVFAVYTPPHGAAPMRASAPTSSAQTPAADSLQPFALPASQVDKDGMLTVPDIRNARATALEHGALASPEAIVMHRTESSTAKSTLDSYSAGGHPNGAHFLIEGRYDLPDRQPGPPDLARWQDPLTWRRGRRLDRARQDLARQYRLQARCHQRPRERESLPRPLSQQQ